jgi:uncharacterized protein YodC (DUF2158 family)
MSDESPWKPGDLVKVKSGGPVMTVSDEDEIGRVICEWFDGKVPVSRSFAAAALKKYEPPRSDSDERSAAEYF